jgi:hypothetical protein
MVYREIETAIKSKLSVVRFGKPLRLFTYSFYLKTLKNFLHLGGCPETHLRWLSIGDFPGYMVFA